MAKDTATVTYPDVVIQEEPRWEAMLEVGPYMVMELDELGHVETTAYFASHQEATDQADALAGEDGEVQDDVGGPVEGAPDTPAAEPTDEPAPETTTSEEPV